MKASQFDTDHRTSPRERSRALTTALEAKNLNANLKGECEMKASQFDTDHRTSPRERSSQFIYLHFSQLCSDNFPRFFDGVHKHLGSDNLVVVDSVENRKVLIKAIANGKTWESYATRRPFSIKNDYC